MGTKVRALTEEERERVIQILKGIHAHADECSPCMATEGNGCEEGRRLLAHWVAFLTEAKPDFVSAIEATIGEDATRAAQRLALERKVKTLSRHLQKLLREAGELQTGFCLLLYDFGDEGSFAYSANAERADVVRLLKEAAQKIGAVTQ